MSHYRGGRDRITVHKFTSGLVTALLVVLTVSTALAAPVLPRPHAIDDTLTIGHLFPIDNLNPFIGFSNEAYLFYALVYDFLFSLDEDQTYINNIAVGSRSTVTERGTFAWVYDIRQGVKWHDGTPLTAEDVAFTVNYNIQAFWVLWAYEPYLNQIVQCRPGRVTECGAEVTGPWEVTVYFERPFSPGGSAMVFPIIQQAQWQSISPSQAQYSYPNANPIGTGPYKADPNIYQQWVNGDPLVLHANPEYHLGAPEVDRVVFRVFDDENSMVAALIRGEIDLAMLSAAGASAVRIANPAGIELQEGITVIHYWIDIGVTQLNHPGVNQVLNSARFDLNVRKAMAHATDKEFIVDQFYRGKGVPGSTLVSPVTPFWHYEPTDEAYLFDLDLANATLDAAGYDESDSDGIRKASRDIVQEVYCSPENVQRGCVTPVTVPQGQRLSFSMVTRAEAPEERQIAEYLKQVWRTVGIELSITTEEEVAMTTDVYGGEFDTYIWWWSADADPNYIMSVQTNFTLNGWSDNYFDNETYNRLYLEQLAALDPSVRQGIVHEALKVHYLAAPFIILVYPFFHYAWWTDEFEGWGNMTAHPGRQVGAFWGAHPLLLDLTPTDGRSGGLGLSGTVLAIIAAGSAVAVGVAVAAAILIGRRKRAAQEALPEIPRPPPPPPRPPSP